MKRAIVGMADICDAGLDPYQFFVAHHVARRDGPSGCFESLDNFAQRIGINKKTVRKALADLVVMGILIRTDRPGTSPVYRVNHDSRSWKVVRGKDANPYHEMASHEVVGVPREGIPSDGRGTTGGYGGVPSNGMGGVPSGGTLIRQTNQTIESVNVSAVAPPNPAPLDQPSGDVYDHPAVLVCDRIRNRSHRPGPMAPFYAAKIAKAITPAMQAEWEAYCETAAQTYLHRPIDPARTLDYFTADRARRAESSPTTASPTTPHGFDKSLKLRDE
jgi:hypothetical protein